MLLADGCGILAEDADLGRRLVEVLGDEGLRRALAAKGAERVGEYSWERMGARHEQAYAEAIARWQARRGAGLSD